MLLLAASLGACSSLFGKDETPPDEPADRIYNEGLFLLNDKHDVAKAAKKFEEVDRQHPYSEWARKALIMSAYSYYTMGSYEECVTSSKRYISLHPGSPDAAYAQYLIGASYFDEIPDITRDQARTEKALDSLDEVIRKYPNNVVPCLFFLNSSCWPMPVSFPVRIASSTRAWIGARRRCTRSCRASLSSSRAGW